MFKSVAKLFAKQLIPWIIANLTLDVDTVVKKDGTYLRIRVEALNFKLVDEDIKISSDHPNSKKAKKAVSLDDPINVIRSNQVSLKDVNRLALGK